MKKKLLLILTILSTCSYAAKIDISVFEKYVDMDFAYIENIDFNLEQFKDKPNLYKNLQKLKKVAKLCDEIKKISKNKLTRRTDIRKQFSELFHMDTDNYLVVKNLLNYAVKNKKYFIISEYFINISNYNRQSFFTPIIAKQWLTNIKNNIEQVKNDTLKLNRSYSNLMHFFYYLSKNMYIFDMFSVGDLKSLKNSFLQNNYFKSCLKYDKFIDYVVYSKLNKNKQEYVVNTIKSVNDPFDYSYGDLYIIFSFMYENKDFRIKNIYLIPILKESIIFNPEIFEWALDNKLKETTSNSQKSTK